MNIPRSTAAARPPIYFRPRSSKFRNFRISSWDLLFLLAFAFLRKRPPPPVSVVRVLDTRRTQLSLYSTPDHYITVTMADEAQDAQLYNGNCHCGRYQFTVRVPEIRQM